MQWRSTLEHMVHDVAQRWKRVHHEKSCYCQECGNEIIAADVTETGRVYCTYFFDIQRNPCFLQAVKEGRENPDARLFF